MTKEQHEFLKLAVIDGLKYDEISAKMNLPRSEFSPWWNELKKEREKLTMIRKIWLKKCENTDFFAFRKWYLETEHECTYCGITEDEIDKLINGKQIFTKRLTTRGRKLEIERLKPNESYDNIENLAFSCYWCNNAKTDEFSVEEFKKLGEVIADIWKRRKSEI